MVTSWVSLLRQYRWVVGIVLLVLVLSALVFSPKISLDRRLLASGKQHEEKREWQEAADEYDRAVHYAPTSSIGIEAARLGGGLCLYELKDYQRAIFFFRHIVRHSQKLAEVRWAQQKLAEIYYEKLNNYPQAILEYQRLLQANPEQSEAVEDKLKLARAYFYMANFDQAISEAQEFLVTFPASDKKFDMLMIKADALLAQKKLDEAIDQYSEIEKEFSKHPDAYQVKLNKSLAYEDKKDWDKAVAELEAIKDTYPHPDVIDLKIKSILRRKERKKE